MTASATDRDLLPNVEGPLYGDTERTKSTYTISSKPRFQLALGHAGGTWTVVERATGVYGAGETPSAALEDFQRAIAEHLDVLERQDALSEDLAAQLHYLRERV